MPWCPNCKHEYREGITICADCGETLVDEPPEEAEDGSELPDGEAFLFDRLGEAVGMDAEGAFGELFQESDPNADPAAGDLGTLPTGLYQASADRAEDNRSSAWVLLIIGGLGLIAVVLCATGVLPVRFGSPYLVYGVMSAIFLHFLWMGVISMKNARVFERRAKSENSLEDSLTAWAKENLHGAEIDAEIARKVPAAVSEDGTLYFRRVKEMNARITRQFVNLDPAFLDHLIDVKLYDMVFEGDALEVGASGSEDAEP